MNEYGRILKARALNIGLRWASSDTIGSGGGAKISVAELCAEVTPVIVHFSSLKLYCGVKSELLLSFVSLNDDSCYHGGGNVFLCEREVGPSFFARGVRRSPRPLAEVINRAALVGGPSPPP